MICSDPGYSYNDLTIVPSGDFTTIKSRSECNPYYKDGMLPLFTAPMSCVVDETNYALWEYYKINAILPRTVKYAVRMEFLYEGKWVALSLKEFKDLFCDIEAYKLKQKHEVKAATFKVCIDIANGHMKQIYDSISKAKYIADIYGYKVVIMTGNIANPALYKKIIQQKIPVDYIRLSIGSGNGCLTSSNTGVHYPIGSLIAQCKNHKGMAKLDHLDYPKIIADGGIRNYKDINIALALGADYVMVGSLFASIIESSAKTYIVDNPGLREKLYEQSTLDNIKNAALYNYSSLDDHMKDFDKLLKADIKYYGDRIKKRFYGMSTKEAQIEINNALEYPADFVSKTSEGVAKMLDCKYTIRQWTENFIDYLRSAMSYTNNTDLYEFTTCTDLIVNSTKTVDSVNK